MSVISSEYHNLNPEVINWAKGWREKDEDYLHQRAQFAPEPTRSIAKLILAIADPEAVNTSGKV
jgi:hypothetical protein